MILATLRNHLLTFVDLTTKIGERVYIDIAPRKTEFPYLIISTISGQPAYALGGEVGMAESLVQVSAWSRDPNGTFQADEVAELVRDKISGARGTWDGVRVAACLLQGEPITLLDEDETSAEHHCRGVVSDYQITHARGVPTHA